VTDLFDDAGDVIGMMDFLPSPSLHLIEGHPGVLVPAPVEPEDRAAVVGHPGKLGDVLRQRQESLFAFGQGVLGSLSIRDLQPPH
jgi:hypothetical protein